MRSETIQTAELLAESTDMSSDEILEHMLENFLISPEEWDKLDAYISKLRDGLIVGR